MTNFSLYLAWMTFYVSKFWILGKISKFSKNQVFRPKIGLFQFLFVSTPLLYAAFDGVGRFPQKCIIPFGRFQPLEAALILDIHLWYIFMQRCYDKHFLLSVFCIFHHEKHCPSHLRSSSQRFTNLSPDSFNIQHIHYYSLTFRFQIHVLPVHHFWNTSMISSWLEHPFIHFCIW